MEKVGKFTLEIVKRSDQVSGFQVPPGRWVVNVHLHSWDDDEDL